jgi:carbamoylphosphate synthase small subunit
MEELRKEMNAQMSSLRDEIKHMTRALTELIRLEGEMKAQTGALTRIGRQVDDHETRIRVTEVNGSVNQSQVSSNERIIWIVVTSLISLAFLFLRG